MPIRTEHPDGGTAIVLSDVLDLGAADELTQALRAAHAVGPYTIDARAVSRIATPCLQILLAALRSGEGARLVAPSDATMEALVDLGLLPHFSAKMDLS